MASPLSFTRVNYNVSNEEVYYTESNKIRSVEFGTVGPRPILLLFFLLALITSPFMEPKGYYLYSKE